ncbi:MAG: hypothetical protein R3F11_07830 [Verrucomicrobiales bacterium]
MSLEDRLYPVFRAYEASPQWAKSLAGTCYRMLPQSWRLGKAYAEFQSLIERSLHWTPDEIEAYQVEQLRASLSHAHAHCPYYRDKFDAAGVEPGVLGTTGDLAKFPTIEKRVLIDHREAMASQAIPVSQRLYITTGGSTGVPVGFYLQKGVSRPKEQAFLEAMWAHAGYRPGARVAVMRGAVTSRAAQGNVLYRDATRDWLFLSSYHLTEERLPEYLDALERFRPDFLHFYPSAALQLADLLRRSGRDLGFVPKAMLCGSERLEIPQKRLLEDAFGCRVYRWYGHSERAVLAGEGGSDETFYFWPAYGYTELGEADEHGYREVIATTFHNLAMPLIRYRTGDYVKEAPPGRAREFPWLAIECISGREQEFLVSASGRKISLTAFNMHDGIFDGLYAVQFFQATPGKAEFRYVPAPGFDYARLAQIERGIMRKLGDDFEISFKEVRETEKTPRGKHRWLIAKLTLP